MIDDVNRLETYSYIVVLAGGVNWMFTGLGILSQNSRTVYNPVFRLSEFLSLPSLEAVFYIIVGASALYQIHFGSELYE